jgi:hypothetical protein
MKLKTAAELWRDYEIVLPADASQTQIRETRRAYLSGIYALLVELSMVTDEDRNQSILMYLSALAHELQGSLSLIILEDTGGVT